VIAQNRAVCSQYWAVLTEGLTVMSQFYDKTRGHGRGRWVLRGVWTRL
jgi:hypothetical protein